MLNSTLEVFLIFNLVYLSVFLPKEIEGCIGVVKEGANALL